MKKKTPDDSGATLAGPSFVCSRKCSRSRAAYMCGGGMLAGNTSACSRESSRSNPLGMGYMPLVVRKIPKRGYLMSLRQAVVGASPSRNLQNLSCVARVVRRGDPNREMEGCVAGVRQHSAVSLGVWYMPRVVKKELKSG